MDSDTITETELPEGTETMDLPNAVVNGWAVTGLDATGSEGERHALVAVTFEFQIAPGWVGRQSFIMAKDDAKNLRKDLKSPQKMRVIVCNRSLGWAVLTTSGSSRFVLASSPLPPCREFKKFSCFVFSTYWRSFYEEESHKALPKQNWTTNHGA